MEIYIENFRLLYTSINVNQPIIPPFKFIKALSDTYCMCTRRSHRDSRTRRRISFLMECIGRRERIWTE